MPDDDGVNGVLEEGSARHCNAVLGTDGILCPVCD